MILKLCINNFITARAAMLARY